MGRYSKKEALAKKLALAGIDASGTPGGQLAAIVQHILKHKIHGITFSPYVEGQGPGTQITAEQIRERLKYILPYVDWVRSFSCTEGNEQIPAIAKEHGLKTLVGTWLEDDRENNERELANAIEVAKAGHADILAVGNEVLLREELSEDELIDYITRVKQAVPDVPVGYVDAYFKFVDYPRVTEACDVILANCYPFWESCPAEYALLYMKDMYHRAMRAANGRKVIISETGWPNKGTSVGGATPSEGNAMKYFIDTYRWADEEGVDIFYFSSFDEAWKVDKEGDVGAYWGLWDENGNLKYV